ncbi:MAG TPA: hypothetical protein VGM56_03325 [Byssovorax sp.]
MLGLKRSHATSFALVAAASALFAMAAPSGCFYPDYTFDENATGAGGPGPTTTSTHSGNPMSSSTTSTASHTTSSTTTQTTTSTGNAAGGGGSSGTGMGGNGGSGAGEDCTNGVDDNGDGKVDCADPKCAGYSCVNAIPAGWTGYFALYDGPPGGDPGCPSDFPADTDPSFVGSAGLSFNPSDCECTCGNPTGQTCNFPTELDIFDVPDCNTDCSSDCCFSLPLTPGFTGSCYGMTYVGGTTCGAGHAADCQSTMTGHPCSVSAFLPEPTVTGGACASSGPALKPDTPTWQRLGRGCGDVALTGKGCNNGQVCLPKPKAPYVTGVCISQSGDVQCPPSQFSVKHTFFQSYSDGRSCGGTCACDDPAGGGCTATIHVYTDLTVGTCSMQETDSPFPSGTCKNLTGNPNMAGMTGTKSSPTGGTCTPDDSGVIPSGTVTADEPTATTYCCLN